MSRIHSIMVAISERFYHALPGYMLILAVIALAAAGAIFAVVRLRERKRK